jgi:hypothetical protein
MSECVQCGYCCTVRPCVYGAEVVPRGDGVQLVATRGRCRFLTEDNKCAKYDEIVEKERGSRYPMFGCGCSSPMFNEVREAKIRQDNRRRVE